MKRFWIKCSDFKKTYKMFKGSWSQLNDKKQWHKNEIIEAGRLKFQMNIAVCNGVGGVF